VENGLTLGKFWANFDRAGSIKCRACRAREIYRTTRQTDKGEKELSWGRISRVIIMSKHVRRGKLNGEVASILVTSYTRTLQGCRACRATLPVSLPRAYLIGRLAVCCGLLCCPFVRVSRRSPNSTSPTRTTCCGQVAIASS